jgi:N-methylhydantoinase A
VRTDYVRTCVARHAQLDYQAMAELYDGLAGQAHAALAAQGFPAGRQRLIRSADLRYFGQAYELRVPVQAGQPGPELADAAAAAFHAEHRALYGYDFSDDRRQQVEWVNLRVTGIGPIQRPKLAELKPGSGGPARALTGHRPVVFARSAAAVRTAVYWRPQLTAGDTLDGPAVIEEYGATLPVHPGFGARVDNFGNLLVSAGGA